VSVESFLIWSHVFYIISWKQLAKEWLLSVELLPLNPWACPNTAVTWASAPHPFWPQRNKITRELETSQMKGFIQQGEDIGRKTFTKWVLTGFQKRDLKMLDLGFSQVGVPTLVGPLERANLNGPEVQWLRLAVSNGHSRVRVSHPLTWGWKWVQFPNLHVLSIPNDRQNPKTQKSLV
jgi:hypothetical protein